MACFKPHGCPRLDSWPILVCSAFNHLHNVSALEMPGYQHVPRVYSFRDHRLTKYPVEPKFSCSSCINSACFPHFKKGEHDQSILHSPCLWSLSSCVPQSPQSFLRGNGYIYLGHSKFGRLRIIFTVLVHGLRVDPSHSLP